MVKEEREKRESERKEEYKINYEKLLVDKQGNEYRYTVCHKDMGRFFAGIGGAFIGMISVGIAELQEYHLVAKCKVPVPVALADNIISRRINVNAINRFFLKSENTPKAINKKAKMNN